MQSHIVILSFLFVVSLSHAAFQNVFNFEIPKSSQRHDQRFSDVINNILTDYHFPRNGHQNIIDILTHGRKQMLKNFIFKDCGSSAGEIKDLKLLPDPLTFPGPLTVVSSVVLNQTLSAPLQTTLVMEKDGVKIPCLDKEIGSCSFNDICALLDTIVQCPDPLVSYGIPCKCPFEKNTYNLPEATFDIEVPFLLPGNYHINAKINQKLDEGTQAVCLDIYATIA